MWCLGLGCLLGAARDAVRLALGEGPVRCFFRDIAVFAAAAVLVCGFAAGASAGGLARWYMSAALLLGAVCWHWTVQPAVHRCAAAAAACLLAPLHAVEKTAVRPLKKRLAAGEPYVIRQKIPRTGITGFDDVVYGHIEVENSEMDDQILIKTDGMPTYNFANVVDDHLMGITHVIRGSEYLSSTPKYNLLYEAFGWEKPIYVHCPPVMKDAQNKLSKRNGDASYQDLVAKGYLPAAVLNYLLLLGWAPEGEQEIFSLDEMIKIWDPARISKSPAIFDPLKLRAINAAYIRALPAEEFRRLADPFIDSAVHCEIDRDLLCANLQPRCEVLGEIPAQLDFFDAVLPIDAEMYRNKKQKTTPESAKEALTALLPVLEAQADWNRDAIFEACKTLAEQMEKKNGWLLFPLGIALSGKQRTPGGGTDLACMMGRETTIARVNAAIEKLNG